MMVKRIITANVTNGHVLAIPMVTNKEHTMHVYTFMYLLLTFDYHSSDNCKISTAKLGVYIKTIYPKCYNLGLAKSSYLVLTDFTSFNF